MHYLKQYNKGMLFRGFEFINPKRYIEIKISRKTFLHVS